MDFAQVEYILVDPSCSGSGIVKRFDDLFSPTRGDQGKTEILYQYFIELITFISLAEEDDGSNVKEEEQKRLESLSTFQLTILMHCFRCTYTYHLTAPPTTETNRVPPFHNIVPNVKKIVYSTCSIHQKENEDVVSAALDLNRGRFKLMHALPSWKRRGLPVFPEGMLI